MRSAVGLILSQETQTLVRQSLFEAFSLSFLGQNEKMREALGRQSCDLILLDLALGEEDVLRFGAELRADQRFQAIPIVYLCNVRDTGLLVRAFDSGGDDLIYVPFAPDELRVRVEAKFRRLKDQPIVHDLFWRGDLRFSLGTQRVVSTDAGGESDLELTPNEFKILYLLARHEGKTLTRQTILHEVWGENLHVVERTVDKHICSLRRKMGKRSLYVASVPGAGYCFDSSSFQFAAPSPSHASGSSPNGTEPEKAVGSLDGILGNGRGVVADLGPGLEAKPLQKVSI